jgi:hypothetical protein
MSFVAPPPSSSPSAPDTADLVDGGGFYPPVEISNFRDSMRVSTAITDTRVRDALRSAILTVRVELRAWAAAKVAAGAPTLDAVECDEVDFEPVLVVLYRRALFSFAAAELVETHNDISATKDGKDRIEEQLLTADEHRRNGTHAIRDILGVSRTSVGLI